MVLIHSLRFSIVALVIASQSVGAQDPRAAGCWLFDRSYFRWYVMRPAKPLSYDSTTKLQLTVDRSTYDAAFNVVPIPPIVDSIAKLRFGRLSTWRHSSADSVHINWTDGLHGYWFHLSGRDTLTGVVGRISDVGRVDSAGRFVPDVPPPETARAVRIPCP